MIAVGKWYRLESPGTFAKVLQAPPCDTSKMYPHLVESLVLRARWFVNDKGEPASIGTPKMIVPESTS